MSKNVNTILVLFVTSVELRIFQDEQTTNACLCELQPISTMTTISTEDVTIAVSHLLVWCNLIGPFMLEHLTTDNYLNFLMRMNCHF